MRLLKTALVWLLLLTIPAAAQDYQGGIEAYMRGDYEAALRELRPLAEQGDIFAQVSLADMNERGVGLPQDYAEAAKWWRVIAERGNAHGQYKLGLLFEYGRGVRQDLVQAHMWFNIAAAAGYPAARENRDVIGAKLSSDEIAEARHMAGAWRARHPN